MAAFAEAQTDNYTQEDYQIASDAGYVKGLEFTNTVALADYCSPSGYVPEKYINKFKLKFGKTISNANGILEKYMTKEEIQTEVIDKLHPSCIQALDNIFNDLHSQYGISRKQFCQLFDGGTDDILSDKLQILKSERPNMYKD